LQQRIDQMQQEFGGLIEAINWLSIDPVVNVGAQGINIYKQVGNVTAVFISGVGLRKADVQPRAWISVGGKDILLNVDSASPSGVKFVINNNNLQASGTVEYSLKMEFSRGYSHPWLKPVLPDSWNAAPPLKVSIPLHICVLGLYSIEAKMTASGERWDRKSEPSDAGQYPYMACNKGDSSKSFPPICPTTRGDYEVDGSVGHGGLTADGCDGREEHSCEWHGSCYGLWCSAEHSPGGGWVKGLNVMVHLRKRIKEVNCGVATAPATSLVYGRTTQLRS
jgi:hypothetical protein